MKRLLMLLFVVPLLMQGCGTPEQTSAPAVSEAISASAIPLPISTA